MKRGALGITDNVEVGAVGEERLRSKRMHFEVQFYDIMWRMLEIGVCLVPQSLVVLCSGSLEAVLQQVLYGLRVRFLPNFPM